MSKDESDKLIAEFMDYIIELNPYTKNKCFKIPEHSREVGIEGNSFSSCYYDLEYLEYELKYNSSLDWLMPVVEKIAKMDNTWVQIIPCEISQRTAWITIERQVRYEKIYISEHDDNLLTAIYNAVVKFIKQYNKEDKQC